MTLLTPFPVYFGGKMDSEWTEHGLNIHYSDRSFVIAYPEKRGGFYAVPGSDPLLAAEINDCRSGAKRAYFDTYTFIASAISQWDGGDLAQLPEYISCPFSLLALSEFLRILLDDIGLPWEKALELVSRCSFQPAAASWKYTAEDFSEIQPRTAQLLQLLISVCRDDQAVLQCLETVLSRLISHDAAIETYRFPIGAVPTDSILQLRITDASGLVESAALLLSGNGYSDRQPLSSELLCTYHTPSAPIALRYRFRLSLQGLGECWLGSAAGKESSLVSLNACNGFRLTVYQQGFETPAWFRRSVMYQIFPDRFAADTLGTAQKGYDYHRRMGHRIEVSSWDSPVKWQPGNGERDYVPNDFYGGTFKGIESKLPYLKSLGVGVVYLNPIVEACSNHRYDTADYRKPDPILGTLEDFRCLCRSAKELGIRIMLDGVYSHTGMDSIYFDRFGHYGSGGACSGPDSPYYCWYDFSHFPDKYRCWWGFESLPEVNEENPFWQDFIISGENSVVRAWLRDGAAGWRLDVADELPDSVLERIRKAVKEESPDYVVLGEVWEDAVEKESYGTMRTYALGNALDSVMNYPLRNAILSFLGGQTSAFQFADFLLAQRLHYPKPMYYSLMNLLSSHDVPRIRTMLAIAPEPMPNERAAQAARRVTRQEDARGAALQKLAAAICYCLPGVPSVYYGDETGMNGFRDPFNRAPFTQGEFPLTDWYTALGTLRNSASPLSTGGIGIYASGNDLLLLLRTVCNGQDVFGDAAENGVYVLAVNRGEQPVRETVSIFTPGHGLEESQLDALRRANPRSAIPLLGDGHLHICNGNADVSLAPVSACIFKLQ